MIEEILICLSYAICYGREILLIISVGWCVILEKRDHRLTSDIEKSYGQEHTIVLYN